MSGPVPGRDLRPCALRSQNRLCRGGDAGCNRKAAPGILVEVAEWCSSNFTGVIVSSLAVPGLHPSWLAADRGDVRLDVLGVRVHDVDLCGRPRRDSELRAGGSVVGEWEDAELPSRSRTIRIARSRTSLGYCFDVLHPSTEHSDTKTGTVHTSRASARRATVSGAVSCRQTWPQSGHRCRRTVTCSVVGRQPNGACASRRTTVSPGRPW